MLFSADAWPGLADGSITCTFRTWRRLQVRVGGRYHVGGLLVEVDRVRRVPLSAVTDRDARSAGSPDRAALLHRLGTDDPVVWRIDLHYLGPDDRIALRAADALTDAELQNLRARLDRLDAHAIRPWTRQTLRLIDAHPGTVSTVLAEEVAMPRPDFKINVRKLKNLGLTESLPIGYRLSPRGQRVLSDADRPDHTGANRASARDTAATSGQMRPDGSRAERAARG
jgi:hypothetical protein